jgi:hypothetical protein
MDTYHYNILGLIMAPFKHIFLAFYIYIFLSFFFSIFFLTYFLHLTVLFVEI